LKNYLTKKGIKLGIIVLVFALVVALITGLLGGKAGLARNLSGTLSKPVQKCAQSIADWLGDIYGYMFRYDALEQENETLKQQLAEAQAQIRQVDSIQAENDQLNELLGFSQSHSDYELEATRVIARSSSNWSSTMTINKGSGDDVAVGDPVITETGALVGQVTEVGTHWATVTTVVDASTNIGAIASQTGSTGMIIGEYSLMQQGLTRITYLPNDSQIFEGDTVITSGVGGAFPYGLVIGTISSVQTEGGGQIEYGVITPGCTLGTLSQIFVIKDFEVVD